jgi:hypothetical protein
MFVQFQGYPTIKMFPPGRKHQIAVLDYKGASTAEDIVAWVFENLKEDESTTESVRVLESALYLRYSLIGLYGIEKLTLAVDSRRILSLFTIARMNCCRKLTLPEMLCKMEKCQNYFNCCQTTCTF